MPAIASGGMASIIGALMPSIANGGMASIIDALMPAKASGGIYSIIGALMPPIASAGHISIIGALMPAIAIGGPILNQNNSPWANAGAGDATPSAPSLAACNSSGSVDAAGNNEDHGELDPILSQAIRKLGS